MAPLPDSPNPAETDEGTSSTTPAILIAAGIVLMLCIGGGLYWKYGMSSAANRADILLHAVKNENLDLTVVERGTLESSDNKDVICRVKAGSKGNYAATIKWVIDDGTKVVKGQPIMTLDSSALEDQQRAQKIVKEQAHAAMIAAEQNLFITVNQNESDRETARIAIQLAELDLEKYVGLPKGTLLQQKREDARIMLLDMEAGLESFLARRKIDTHDSDGEFQQAIDDVTGRIELAEADLEMTKDRASYSQRMQLKGYLSPAQVQADESRLSSAREALKKVKAERQLLQKFISARTVKDLSAKVQEAWRAFDRVTNQAHAKEVQADAERRTKRSIFSQEEDKLRDIDEQIKECKIHAPQDGIVVYYIPESSRFSASERGLIQQGASVQEGQKMMRIPNLNVMQVTTRVHEAMFSRIKGDDRKSTGIHESVRVGLLLNLNPLHALVAHSDENLELQREEYRDREYRLAAQGQPSSIRVDAFPERIFKGHVRTVATVASSSDFMSSDVKVYTTIVVIDEPIEGLRPGMSAEVTIHVEDTVKDVLAVPVQAIVGGAESGRNRKVLVMGPAGPEEREIQLGISNEKMAEVREGIKAGDQVILNPKAILGDKAKTREDTAEKGTRGGKGGGKGKEGSGKGGPPGK